MCIKKTTVEEVKSVEDQKAFEYLFVRYEDERIGNPDIAVKTYDAFIHLLRNGLRIALLLKIDDVIKGFVIFKKEVIKDRKWANIQHFAIGKDDREHGLGTTFAIKLLLLLKEKGFTDIQLEVEEKNPRAANFWANKIGIPGDGHIYRLRLDEWVQNEKEAK